jgi:hypothetical protein
MRQDLMITARIALWGKGLRASEAHEEFQRLLPRDARDLVGAELDVDSYHGWPRFMSDVHAQLSSTGAKERALLVRGDHAVALQLGRTTDRHNRPSVFVVAASFAIDWDDASIGARTSAAHAWLRGLADDYGQVLGSDHERVERQLRAGTFVASREFEVPSDGVDDAANWSAILSSVRDWKGITGIGTAVLGALGANALLQTQSSQTLPLWSVDALIHPVSGELSPLTDTLLPWARASAPSPSAPTQPSEQPGTSGDILVREVRQTR